MSLAAQPRRKLAAVMFTDIEGYTRFVQEDESEAVKKIESHREVLAACTSQHNGEIIQFYGDGSLSIYDSAVDAVNCAIEMQKKYTTNQPVPVRIGIHMGDIIQREDGLFGEGVNIASRIQNLGIPGSIYISEKVRNELGSHTHISTKNMGKYRLKNVREKVRVFAITSDGVITPKKRKFFLEKSWVKDLMYPAILALLLFGGSKIFNLNLNGNQFQSSFFSAAEDQISIPLFKNLDAVDSLSYIGDQASHFITYGLSQINSLNVTSYETTSNLLTTEASLGNIPSFGKLTGTSHILRGTYLTWPPNSDSIRFTVMLEDLRGNIEHAFDEVYGSKQDVGEAISRLLSSVKGYLAAKDDKTFSIPNDQAYKAFLRAKDIWSSDYQEAESLLNKSISLDSSFIDAHFYLLSLYYNQSRFDEMIEHVKIMKASNWDLSERQDNMLSYYLADAQGDLQSAFEYLYKEYKYSPKDIFNNTGMMVIARENINNPRLVTEVLEEIDNDSLDYDACTYCRFRIHLGIMAYLDLGRKRAARKLSELMPYELDRFILYESLLRIPSVDKDTSAITTLIERAKDQDLNRDPNLLYYYAGINFINQKENRIAYDYFRKYIATQNPATVEVAHAHYFLGEYEEANAILESLLEEQGENHRILAKLVMSQSKSDMDVAKDYARKLEAMKSNADFGKLAYSKAVAALHIGNTNAALRHLREGVAQGLKFNSHRFNNDPDLMALWDNREYQKILEVEIDLD